EDSVGGLETVGVLHFVIHHDQVRMQLLGFAGRLFAILGLAANFPILTQLEQMLECISHGFAVLCNEHAIHGPRWAFLSWVHQSIDGIADRLTVFHKKYPRHTVQGTYFSGCATYAEIPMATREQSVSLCHCTKRQSRARNKAKSGQSLALRKKGAAPGRSFPHTLRKARRTKR